MIGGILQEYYYKSNFIKIFEEYCILAVFGLENILKSRGK